jgi:hypothetical protein
MKSTLLFLLCLTGSLLSAQNYMDYSKAEVKSALERNGDCYEQSFTTGGVPYISVENRVEKSWKSYYFDSKNLCYFYIITYDINTYTEADINAELNKAYTRSGPYWFDQKSMVRMEYNTELQSIVLKFERRIDE